ncbi:hypothetical protein quinque_015751, partial [Culex quinquefasciatus]
RFRYFGCRLRPLLGQSGSRSTGTPRRLLLAALCQGRSMLGSLFRRLIGEPKKNPLGIADEFYVWSCLLDDVLHHVLLDDDHALDVFEQILQNFVQLLSVATFEQMEMVRVITHSIGRFIVQIFLFVSSDKAQSYEDKQILQAQLDVINRTMLVAESTKFFRDLIDVFSSYWKNRCGIIENIPSKNALGEMEQIKKTLLAIVVVALRKNVGAEHVISLFRCLNDFIVDLDGVCFDWLIKAIPELAMSGMIELKLIKPVDNKWNGTRNQVYHVVKPVEFQQIAPVLLAGNAGPKHCVIEVISTLLGCMHTQLERERWTSNKCLSPSDQIVSSSVLISSIRSTLIYLREQEEYVSFDMFVEERINPFCKVVETCPSLSDFVKRVGMIKESFCYMRKQNEMSVAEALRMYGEQNDEGGFNAEQLQQAYEQYSDQFETYMAETVPEEDFKAKVAVLTKPLLESVQPGLFKEWTAEFKRTEMPKILAGVAAVWSTMVSADVSSTGKYFKPHCIQILCVLRLLGADSGEKGVSKHLAQVLTGQGKSLVLALIAAVLALTGHQVQLVCYNDYLVKRDAKDFADLYDILEIEDAVKYNTYREMANAMIAPEVNGNRMCLRKFVDDLILPEPGNTRPEKPKAQVQDHSVLLMDEVDVFFTKEYYGTEYCPITIPVVPGLCAIQAEIWNLVNNRGMVDVEQVKEQIQIFISSPRFVRKATFDEFLNQPTSYELLILNGENYVRQLFTNKRLFTEHLETMITNAISIATAPSLYEDYKINNEVFNYFRLKKENYIPFVSGVGANRAAIIFFYDDKLLEDFRAQYCGQFDRLQVLTENTEQDKHEHLIGEAGVAKTVTLATRGMGRGVDYKSSVAVEKNGGVHVIQSFFSLDVKEETQIRGRTARKDNRGSYELIVLDEHLKTQQLIEAGQQEVTYARLDVARTKIALKENKDIEVSIEKNTNNHLTTLTYLQSFFK